MSRPVYEPSTPRAVRSLGFSTDQLFRRPPPVRRGGLYEIKIFADRGALDGNLPDSAVIVSAGDGKFMLVIPPDLNGASLFLAEAGISAAGADDVEVEIINVGDDPGTPGSTNMLNTTIVIPAGDYISWTAGSSVGTTDIAAAPDDLVASGDWVSINVLAGSSDTAEGLAVILAFGF